MAIVDSKEIFDIMFDNNIIVSYVGPFDGQILSILASNIEDSLWQDPHRGKKFFKIFIELSQNISLYSQERIGTEENSSGIGILLIKEFEDHFKILTGNVLNNDEANHLEKKFQHIKDMDRDELREYKRELRSLPRKDKGGGNIGLIQVALLSGYSLDHQFIDINNKSLFFIISTRLDK